MALVRQAKGLRDCRQSSGGIECQDESAHDDGIRGILRKFELERQGKLTEMLELALDQLVRLENMEMPFDLVDDS
jgi:hypothetical protein